MSYYIVCYRNIDDHCDFLMSLGDELSPANKNFASSNRVQRATSLLVCNCVAPTLDIIKTIVRLFTCLFNDCYCRNIFTLRLFRLIRAMQVAAILLVTCIVLYVYLRLAVLIMEEISGIFYLLATIKTNMKNV